MGTEALSHFWRRDVVLTKQQQEQNVSGGLMLIYRQKSTALGINHFYIIKCQTSPTLKEITQKLKLTLIR